MAYTLQQADLDRWDQTSIPEEFPGYIGRIRAERARTNRESWIGAEHPRYAWVLSQLVGESRPQAVLELGTQSGGSAYGLTVNLDPGALFVGIDNEDSVNAIAGGSNFQHLFPRERSAFVTASAAAVLPLLNPVWDLIHFDHYKECYLPDLDLLLRLDRMHPETVCVFHDVESFAKHHRGAIEARFRTCCFVGVPEGALFCQEVLP